MSNYSQELLGVARQLMMCASIVEKCASKLDALQKEVQELIALVGQESEGDLQALVQALAAISEAKADAINTMGLIGEAQQVINGYRDGL